MPDYSFINSIQNSSSVSFTEKIPAGILEKINIMFPSGCNGLVKIRIYINEVQVSPFNPSQYHAGNNESIIINPSLTIPSDSILKVIVVNDDEVYSHTPIIRVSIVSPIRNLSDAKIGVNEYEILPKKRSFWDKILGWLKDGNRST